MLEREPANIHMQITTRHRILSSQLALNGNEILSHSYINIEVVSARLFHRSSYTVHRSHKQVNQIFGFVVFYILKFAVIPATCKQYALSFLSFGMHIISWSITN